MTHRSSGHRRQGNLPPTKLAVRRTVTRTGISHREPPSDLNATERLVFDVLDDEWVPAREVAGFAGITVGKCRRALATLRTLGMAELERPRRRNATNVWRRAT